MGSNPGKNPPAFYLSFRTAPWINNDTPSPPAKSYPPSNTKIIKMHGTCLTKIDTSSPVFYLFRMHKAKESAGPEAPSAHGEGLCHGRAQALGWFWAWWGGQDWQQRRGIPGTGWVQDFEGNHSRWTQGWNPSWFFAVPQLLQSSGSKVFKLEWILFSSPCRKVFNNKSSYQSSGYEKRGSIKSRGRNTDFCLY